MWSEFQLCTGAQRYVTTVLVVLPQQPVVLEVVHGL